MLWSRWREKCTWAEGTGRVLWQQSGAEELRRRKQLRQFLATGVIAYHSDLCSHHCRLCPVLLALLPAWIDSWVISCQEHQSFRNDALANILFGQGRPSAWFARLETIPNTPPPNSSCDRKNKPSQILKIYMCLRFCLCNCNLPTWTDPWVINCQDTKAQARMPLQTICLAAADRQHGLRGLPGAA